MILHIVTFNFRSPWSWASIEAIEAEQATRNHPAHIPQIRAWVCGRNISNRSIAADFVVIGLFDNQETLAEYIQHPDHQIGVAKWKALADWHVVDIDLTSSYSLAIGDFELLKSMFLEKSDLIEA
ncbi:Dabb family protein (plasmid) [Photobacterium sp. GJ3]|uniref:Dabb family protein n=1 Tax=Photobacterium sp. GJ3 TaxID=2829502 RepID=UPI001B8C50D3|nr:Dabb family protein [Photobacterium sp. GJ3]QUJ69481.1 Dabb family protein [Photobacterium sp. GJ3]